MMMKRHNLLLNGLLLVAILVGSHCKETFVVDDTDQTFPITLRHSTVAGTQVFEWDAAQISNFDRYIIVRDDEPIPLNATPNTAQTVFSTNKIDEVRFEDGTPSFSSASYYKLYIQIGERFIESDNVAVTQGELLFFDGSPFKVRFLPDSNWVVILNIDPVFGTGKLQVINYNTGIVLGTLENIQANQYAMTIGYRTGKPVLYTHSPNGDIITYQLPGLGFVNSSASGVTAFSIATNENNLVISTVFDFSNSISTRNSTNLQFVGGSNDDLYFQQRTLLLLNGQSNLFLSAAQGQMRKFNISSTGKAINTVIKNTNFFNLFQDEIPVSKDKMYFMPYRDGDIYNQNLEIVAAQQGLFNNAMVDLAFSNDNAYIYTISNSFTIANTMILSKFSFPGLTLEKEQVIKDVQPFAIHNTDAGLVFIGSNINQKNKFVLYTFKNW